MISWSVTVLSHSFLEGRNLLCRLIPRPRGDLCNALGNGFLWSDPMSLVRFPGCSKHRKAPRVLSAAECQKDVDFDAGTISINRAIVVTQGVPDRSPANTRCGSIPRPRGARPCATCSTGAIEILSQWIDAHRRSFPPVVVHITDGESQDGDPVPYAESLRDLATEDGHVLLLNCHLSMTAAEPFLFPSSQQRLPDDLAKVLFRMSSVLPEPFAKHAAQEGFQMSPDARGMAFNADMVCLIQFLNMGTKAAPGLR